MTLVVLAVVLVYATLAAFAWSLAVIASGPTPVPTPRPTLGAHVVDVPRKAAA